MKKAIIFSKGKYPIGSWHQRIRMMQKGFKENSVDFRYVVPFPAPIYDSIKESESFVKFILKPVEERRKRNLSSIFFKILGTTKGFFFLLKQKDIEFIILPGLDFFEGLLVFTVCKIEKIKFYAEIADEIGKLFSEEKLSFIDKLAKYNQILYEKFILKKADRIFLFTNYLENKYKKNINGDKLFRTIPSMIDLNSFIQQQSNNITEIKQDKINILLQKDSVRIVYAGACDRTNGLKFSLECFAEIINKINIKVEIIFFFVYGNVDKVKAICNKLNIIDYVYFFKPVYPKYIPAIYDHADILVLPEHGDVVANAGFPGKTSEYLASGKAIISTIFSDLTDYLINEYNAMISPIGDKKTYCANLKRLIEDKDLREKLGSNAIKTAKEKFDAKEAVKIYLEND